MSKIVYLDIEALNRIVEIAKRHGLPESEIIIFAVLESMVADLGGFLASKYGSESFVAVLKEIAELTQMPLTDEQLKTYAMRTKDMVKLIEKKRGKKR